MTDIDGTVAELAQLWPALAAALARDTAVPDGPAASPAWTAVAVVNPDVLAAIILLDTDVPATVRAACHDISEPWRHRDLPGCLRQIPRLAGRMRDLGHINAEQALTWDALSWLRLVKRALGLRKPDMPVGYACPWADTRPEAHTAGCGLFVVGREGFLRSGAEGAWVQWVDSGLIYCVSDTCGASWGPAQWPLLGRLLRQVDAA